MSVRDKQKYILTAIPISSIDGVTFNNPDIFAEAQSDRINEYAKYGYRIISTCYVGNFVVITMELDELPLLSGKSNN